MNFKDVEVSRYGPGKIFGEIPYVLPDNFKNYQPLSVKCTSFSAEVFRISAIEFEKNILSNDYIFSYFKKVCMDNIITNSFSKLRFGMTFKNFYNQIGDVKIDQQINQNFEKEMKYLKASQNKLINESKVKK